MGVVYYKQNKNILEPHLSWEGMRLVYVSFNDSKETLTPTAVHCHENNLELQYICGGRGNIRIGRRLYEVQKGDILVYNQGKFHDESADPQEGLWFYNCGVTGISLPGQSEGVLIERGISPRLHAGELSEEIESLFRLLYIEVDRNLPKNDEITQAVLRALVEIILYQLPREKQPPSKEKERLLIDCKDYIGRADGGEAGRALAYECLGLCASVQEDLRIPTHPVHHPAAHRPGTDLADHDGPLHHGGQRARGLRQHQLLQQSVQALCRNVATELPQIQSWRAPVQEPQ